MKEKGVFGFSKIEFWKVGKEDFLKVERIVVLLVVRFFVVLGGKNEWMMFIWYIVFVN